MAAFALLCQQKRRRWSSLSSHIINIDILLNCESWWESEERRSLITDKQKRNFPIQLEMFNLQDNFISSIPSVYSLCRRLVSLYPICKFSLSFSHIYSVTRIALFGSRWKWNSKWREIAFSRPHLSFFYARQNKTLFIARCEMEMTESEREKARKYFTN